MSRIQLLRLLRAAPAPLVVATSLIVITAGLVPVALIVASGQLSGRLVQGLGSGDLSRITPPFLMVMGLFATGELLGPVQGRLRWLVSKCVDADIRDRIMRVALAGADLSHRNDVDRSQAIADLREMIRSAATPGGGAAGLLGISRNYVTTFVGTLVLFTFQPWVAFAAVISASIMRVRWRRSVFRIIDAWQEGDRSRREGTYLMGLGLERTARMEVRLFGLRPWLEQRIGTAEMAAWTPTWAERQAVTTRSGSLHVLLTGATVLGSLLWAAHATTTGHLTVEGLVIFVPMILLVLALAGGNSNDMAVEYGAKFIPRLEMLERATFEARDGQVGTLVDPGRPPHIEFKGASFAYPGGDTVLNEVNLAIPGGSSLAVVGLNGAGKTTLIRLLCGLYPPCQGAVYINDDDLSGIALTSWHALIAPIFQGSLRIPGDVGANVAAGAIENQQDDAGIVASMKEAGAEGFVSNLPAGSKTLLAGAQVSGHELSGGQWQRLAYARALNALHHGARLLVMDEPTSNLDTAAEEQLVSRLVDQTAGLVTIVLVTHRLALARRCDRIAVANEGRLTEHGTHAELLAREGDYATAFGLQARMYPMERRR